MVEEKATAVIQARMGSTRLPGKVLRTIIDMPSLCHITTRIKRALNINKIIVATTINPEDDVIQKYCEENNLEIFRGESTDVLSRFYFTSLKYQLKIIVRLTADNPLVDPMIVDEVIEYYQNSINSSRFDYIRTTNYPIGLNVEIFSHEALTKSFLEAVNPYDREHVTPYIYNNPLKFKIHNLLKEFEYSNYRLTMDTMEDYTKIKRIFQYFYNQGNYSFGWKEIEMLIKENSQLL